MHNHVKELFHQLKNVNIPFCKNTKKRDMDKYNSLKVSTSLFFFEIWTLLRGGYGWN